jgi:hypothetical protein
VQKEIHIKQEKVENQPKLLTDKKIKSTEEWRRW